MIRPVVYHRFYTAPGFFVFIPCQQDCPCRDRPAPFDPRVAAMLSGPAGRDHEILKVAYVHWCHLCRAHDPHTEGWHLYRVRGRERRRATP